MAQVTAQTLIDGAFRKLGIKKPQATRRANGLEALNDYLGNKSGNRNIIPFMTRESFSLVSGTRIYEIGPSGDFNTVRPLQIISAFIRDANGYDHHVSVVMTLEEHDRITTKDVSTRPLRLWYKPIYPKGKIFFDSEPNAVETLHIESWKHLTEIATLATEVALPDMYKLFLKYAIANELAPEEKIKDTNILTMIKTGLTESMDAIEIVNSQLVEAVVLNPMITYKQSNLGSDHRNSDNIFNG